MAVLPALAALCRGVLPYLSFAFMSTFFSISSSAALCFVTPSVTVSGLQLVAAARARKRAVVLCMWCMVARFRFVKVLLLVAHNGLISIKQMLKNARGFLLCYGTVPLATAG